MGNKKFNTVKEMTEFFWEWFPHETSWAEFKDCNEELYQEVQDVGQELVMLGGLRPSALKD